MLLLSSYPKLKAGVLFFFQFVMKLQFRVRYTKQIKKEQIQTDQT